MSLIVTHGIYGTVFASCSRGFAALTEINEQLTGIGGHRWVALESPEKSRGSVNGKNRIVFPSLQGSLPSNSTGVTNLDFSRTADQDTELALGISLSAF
jgi:hypothetical protein